jgi:hypothetical protein
VARVLPAAGRRRLVVLRAGQVPLLVLDQPPAVVGLLVARVVRRLLAGRARRPVARVVRARLLVAGLRVVGLRVLRVVGVGSRRRRRTPAVVALGVLAE